MSDSLPALKSLSARRAWIEIAFGFSYFYIIKVALRKESVDRNDEQTEQDSTVEEVALRKESVDRNDEQTEQDSTVEESLSARRAWIEIIGYSSVMLNTAPVALRKESVDRNVCSHLRKQFHFCRSPQGERG